MDTTCGNAGSGGDHAQLQRNMSQTQGIRHGWGALRSGQLLSGPLLITPRVFEDNRGFFYEAGMSAASAVI